MSMNPDQVTERHSSVADVMDSIGKRTEETVEPQPKEMDSQPTGQEGTNVSTVELDEDYIETTTTSAIALIDGVQQVCFEIAANQKKKKRIASIDENGSAKLKELLANINANKKQGATVEYTGKEAQLLDVDTTVKDFLASLPFSDSIKDMIRPGMKKMVIKNYGKIPDEFFMMAGIALGIGGNIGKHLAW